MKFLEILLAFLSSQGKNMVQNNAEIVKGNLANNFRRIAALLMTSLVTAALFCVSLSIAFNKLLASYEQNGAWVISTTILVAFITAIVCLAALIFVLSEKRWQNAVGNSDKTAEAVPPPRSEGPNLQAAVALLIVEVIQEIKARREHASTTAPEAPPV